MKILQQMLIASFAFMMLALPATASDWQTYRNHAHGFSIDYPAGLFTQRGPTDDGEGVQFTSQDGRKELSIYGFNNGDELSMKTIAGIIRENYADRDVTYERVTQKWMVLSGYETTNDGRNIFYHRLARNSAGDRLSVFEFSYPESDRAEIDPLLGRMSKSLSSPN